MTSEVKPGVVRPSITEIDIVGDMLEDTANFDQEINPNITLGNKISFIADNYAMLNYQYIKYVKIDGDNAKWNVKKVTIKRPRLILTLGGGVYNG